LLYDATDQGGGVRTYTVKAPVDPSNPMPPVAIIKALGPDPVTGAKRYGNEFLFRWQGRVPELAEIEVDVDDIIDPTGFFPIPVTNITTYAETSMGLCLAKANEQIIPQDGLNHLLLFRVRYHVNGDAGPYVQTPVYSAVHAVPPPAAPASLTATRLRDRTGDVGDVVHFSWAKAAVNGGDGIEIYTTTVLDKAHRLYQSNGAETSCRIDNVSRFVVREDESEVQPEPFGFYIVATNISGKSDPTNGNALTLTPRLKPSRPPTPDELAGTAREVEYATLKAEVFADVLSALGALPAEGQSIVNSAVDQAFLKIKDVVRLGGSVEVADFGVVAAKWTNERLARNPATGAPIVVPPYRNLGFTPSLGFKDGTKAGTILTDAQAKALREA
jgi:nucleoid DNA-binding protein